MRKPWKVTRASLSRGNGLLIEGFNYYDRGRPFYWTIDRFSYRDLGHFHSHYDFTETVFEAGAHARHTALLAGAEKL